MVEWKNECLQVVHLVLGDPASAVEMWVLAGVSLFAAILAFDIVGGAVGIPNTGKGNATIVVVAGTCIVLAALTAANVFLVPNVSADLEVWVLPASGTIVSLIVIVPFVKVFLKGNLVNSLIAWVVSLLIGAAAIIVLGVGWDMVSGGEEKLKGAKDRRDGLQRIIDE